jgi:DNA-binding NtrC family response regulator
MVSTMSQVHVLVVDDDPALRDILQETLVQEGYSVSTAEDGTAAIRAVREAVVHIVITDFQLPDIDGLAIIDRLAKLDAKIIPIMMTGFGTIETAVRAMKSGAFDFITKPFDLETVAVVVRKAAEFHRLRQENHLLRKAVRDQYRLEQLVGISEPMQQVMDFVQKVADSDSTVMIQGESGTGKELVARMLHFNSLRRDRPLVPVNCGAIPENLLESELFGHEKGAFTGSTNEKAGAFEMSSGGTIFLDEMAEMPVDIQVKLLRALETRQIRRLGGKKEINVDIRIVAATNKNLQKAIVDGELREDLYYRIAVVEIDLPPLRERADDIQLLANEFLGRFAQQNGKTITGFEDAAWEWIMSYHWPGNVRELKNAVERAVIMSRSSTIGPDDIIPRHLRGGGEMPAALTIPVGATAAEARRQLVLRTFASTSGDATRTAKVLGLSVEDVHTELRALLNGAGDASSAPAATPDGTGARAARRPEPAAAPARATAKKPTAKKGR